VEQGVPGAKIAIASDRGSSWQQEIERTSAIRNAIGPDAELCMDANG
jgi:L-alanine-DL-glutamate epimerase-like enolase superfamily enzyme